MQTVTSKDGVQIAYEKSGTGPPLVLIGGALSDHNFHTALAAELAKDFTVYNFDRRGRGESTDAQAYSPEREIEDVAALIANANEPAYVYGFSSGSALALRTAAAEFNITKLVLSYPPYSPHSENDEKAKADFGKEAADIQALHDKGDHRGSAKYFLSMIGLPDEAIEGMLQSPSGQSMIDSARALPYDYAVLGPDGLVPTELAQKVKVPTLIVTANDTMEAAKALEHEIPDARLHLSKTPIHELPPAEMAVILRQFLID